MTGSQLPDVQAFLAEERALGVADRDPWLARLGPATALWLAAVPQWTVGLADAVAMPLPPDMSSAAELAQLVCSGGLAARRVEPAPGRTSVELFWLDETTARRWITGLRRQTKDLPRQV